MLLVSLEFSVLDLFVKVLVLVHLLLQIPESLSFGVQEQVVELREVEHDSLIAVVLLFATRVLL